MKSISILCKVLTLIDSYWKIKKTVALRQKHFLVSFLWLIIKWSETTQATHRSGPSDVFLGKDVLKICCKFTGEHPCQNLISIKLLCNFIEITLRHLLHIFKTTFSKNTSGGLLLNTAFIKIFMHTSVLIGNKISRSKRKGSFLQLFW